jgi:hypothetical protein
VRAAVHAIVIFAVDFTSLSKTRQAALPLFIHVLH